MRLPVHCCTTALTLDASERIGKHTEKFNGSNSDARACISEQHAVPVHRTFCAVALPAVDIIYRLCRCSGHFWVLFTLRLVVALMRL